MIILYTTHRDRASAEAITTILLEQRLIACVNYFPIEACLVWQGEQTTQNEVVALYKTSNATAADAEATILKHHPYEIPCIIKIPVTANSSYENWVKDATTL